MVERAINPRVNNLICKFNNIRITQIVREPREESVTAQKLYLEFKTKLKINDTTFDVSFFCFVNINSFQWYKLLTFV